MAKRPDRPSEPLMLTPPPSYTSGALAKAIIEARADTKFIREDLLKPLVKDTKEARDKAREALTKVDAHMADADSHEHPCVEAPRQARQDDVIGTLKSDNIETKAKTSNIAKLVWWMMSSAIGIALIAGGYTWSGRLISAENATKLEGTNEKLGRHEREIDSLEKATQRDREIYLREMRNLPSQVTEAAKQTPPTVEEMEGAADDLPLTEREQRMLFQILKSAKKRSNGKAVHVDG